VRRVADLAARADALLITAGAGMSVESGVPDFRSPQVLWRAYPPLANAPTRRSRSWACRLAPWCA